MTKHPMRVLSGLLIAGALAGCQEPLTQQQTLADGVTEIRITGIGSGTPSASARSVPGTAEAIAPDRSVSAVAMAPTTARTLTPRSSGIQLDPVSVSTFTSGPRPGGFRYVAATYRVRNANSVGDPYSTARQNLTFVAYGNGASATAISQLKKFDGSTASFSATLVAPTGAATFDRATGNVTSSAVDILQVYTEGEITTAGVSGLVPYGFVVSNPGSVGSRSLAGSPAVGQFDGVVTFAFKYPLQANANNDAFTIVGLFVPVDDDQAWVLQSAEDGLNGEPAAITSRATALNAQIRSVLGSTVNAQSAGLICSVRSAGSAGSPTAFVPGSC